MEHNHISAGCAPSRLHLRSAAHHALNVAVGSVVQTELVAAVLAYALVEANGGTRKTCMRVSFYYQRDDLCHAPPPPPALPHYP